MQHRLREFLVLHVKCHQGSSPRMRKQGVAEIDIGLREVQFAQAPLHFFRGIAEGHHHQLAAGVWDALFKEDLLRDLRVSLVTIRATVASLESWTLKPSISTRDWCRSRITDSKAPARFWRKTENCRTGAPIGLVTSDGSPIDSC